MSVTSKMSQVNKALELIRKLPRVGLGNIKDNPGAYKKTTHGRGRYGGKTQGCGSKGSGQRQNIMRVGYETGNDPFHLRFQREPYHQGHHLRRQYPPLSLKQLQLMIDTDRLDPSRPIDLPALCNTGLYSITPYEHHYGVNLTAEGADCFKAKVNIEVQWTSEEVIAAIERNGGVITTAYFDIQSLYALINPEKFFQKGNPIPKRMIPPQDAVDYYTNEKNRGYLADPEKLSQERLVLAQKFGYDLPKIEDDPFYSVLSEKKNPQQIFYGLQPGWLVNLIENKILKPCDPELIKYYQQ